MHQPGVFVGPIAAVKPSSGRPARGRALLRGKAEGHREEKVRGVPHHPAGRPLDEDLFGIIFDDFFEFSHDLVNGFLPTDLLPLGIRVQPLFRVGPPQGFVEPVRVVEHLEP